MLGPAPIELSALVIGQFEGPFTLRVRKAFPKGDGGPTRSSSRELEEVRERA